MVTRPGLLLVLALSPAVLSANPLWRFCFGGTPCPAGAIHVASAAAYDPAIGYGFEEGVAAPRSAPGFYFSARLPKEGNYDVTVTVGDPRRSADTTVKAELRRLYAIHVRTAAGASKTLHFVVNLRTPAIPGGGVVRLKPREKTGEFWDWDDKLTLEFDGASAAVEAVEISPAPPMPTVYIAGDSTVCDQPYEPYASWGQMLTYFFGPGVAIANHAESGESLRSFIGERRLAKLDTLMKPGDYLFIQSGHNDQKERGPGIGALTSYKRELEHFVADARAHGVTPVLVTPVSRRTFGPDGTIVNSLGDFPLAVREVAREQHTALIDLNAMSETLYNTLGPSGAVNLFALANGKREGTHHNDYGAYEIARCIVTGIRQNGLPLAKFLKPDAGTFDPQHPDPFASFPVPPSPRAADIKPYGN